MNRQAVSSDSNFETCEHDSTWTTPPDALLTNTWFR
jgi:hypothetical protein